MKENHCGFSMEARETEPGLSVLAVSVIINKRVATAQNGHLNQCELLTFPDSVCRGVTSAKYSGSLKEAEVPECAGTQRPSMEGVGTVLMTCVLYRQWGNRLTCSSVK